MGVAARVVGTVSVLSLVGGVTFRPKDGRTIFFGRNRPLVHVCIGENDRRISRRDGTLVCDGHRWWVSNEGGQPIRIAESQLLFRGQDPIALDSGYTPLFIRGTARREHLLEIFVTDAERSVPGPLHLHDTCNPTPYPLTDEERLVLIVLAQRYLRYERNTQPWTREATANLLAEMQPQAQWKLRRVDDVVAAVRQRLTGRGVKGLQAKDLPQPIGNMLNHNLIQELMLSGTLVPRDLERIDL